MGGFLEKAGVALGPEIGVDRCEMPEAEAGRNSMNMGGSRQNERGDIGRHTHLQAYVF